MKINTKGLDPRALCMDDVFIRVLKLYQKDRIEEDGKHLKRRSSDKDIFKCETLRFLLEITNLSTV